MNKKILLDNELFTTQTHSHVNGLQTIIEQDGDKNETFISSLVFPTPHTFHIQTKSGRQIKGHFHADEHETLLFMNGLTFSLKNISSQAQTTGGDSDYKSPMPGKVLKILVEEGEQVKEGQDLLVVEAMKMENLIQSRAAGTVDEVNCKEGEIVDQDMVLIKLS